WRVGRFFRPVVSDGVARQRSSAKSPGERRTGSGYGATVPVDSRGGLFRLVPDLRGPRFHAVARNSTRCPRGRDLPRPRIVRPAERREDPPELVGCNGTGSVVCHRGRVLCSQAVGDDCPVGGVRLARLPGFTIVRRDGGNAYSPVPDFGCGCRI